jgi:hypothetical protein
MEITKEKLIEGKTVLLSKNNPENKRLYLGNVGLVYFASMIGKFIESSPYYYTIQELNEKFIIEQEQSLTVPLERKVYDFVPVYVKDYEKEEWKERKLIAVLPNALFPYHTDEGASTKYAGAFKICEFINPQQ